MKHVRRIVMASVLFATCTAGCSTPSKQKKPELVERAARCEMSCAELALGLLESSQYREARAALEPARRHAEDPARPDVPEHPARRMARQVDFAVADLVTAKHVGEEVEPLVTDLTELLDLVLDEAPALTFDYLTIDYLPRQDQIWLLRTVRERSDLDVGRRFLVLFLWRSNSDLPVDILHLKRLAAKLQTDREHEIALRLYCEMDRCGSEPALVHMAAIIDAERASDEPDADRLSRLSIHDFFRHAGPEHRERLNWLVNQVSSEQSWHHTPLAFPEAAYRSDRKACELMGPVLDNLVEENNTDYETLLASARCALYIGRKDMAMTLLDRALFVEKEPIEAYALLVKLTIIDDGSRPAKEFVEALEELAPDHDAIRFATAYRALWRGATNRARESIRDLPYGPGVSYLRGLSSYQEGQWERALRHFENAFDQWKLQTLGGWLTRAAARAGRVDDAVAELRVFYRRDPDSWDFRLHRALWYANDREGLEEILERWRADDASCFERYWLIRTVAAFDGPSAAWSELDSMLTRISPFVARQCRKKLLRAAFVAGGDEGPKRIASRLWGPDEPLGKTLVGGFAFHCPSMDRRTYSRGVKRHPEHAGWHNSYAWCALKGGDHFQALKILPDEMAKTHAPRDTRALALLRTGKPDAAAAIWAELTSGGYHTVYSTHHLAARILSSNPPSRDVLEQEIDLLRRRARFSLPTPGRVFAQMNVARSLEAAGYDELALEVYELLTVESRVVEVMIGVEEFCPSCPQAFRDAWGDVPRVWSMSPAPPEDSGAETLDRASSR